jgi:hypothetical protein
MPVNSGNIYLGTYAKDCNWHFSLVLSLLEEGDKNPNTSLKCTSKKGVRTTPGEQVKEVK